MQLPRRSEIGVWLCTPIHISWLITAIAAGVLAGTAIGPWLTTVISAHGSWPVLAGIIIGILPLHQRRAMMIVAFLGAGLFGVWLGMMHYHDFSGYEPYYGETVTFGGVVAHDVTITEQQQHIRLKDVVIGESRLPGEVWFSTSFDSEVKRGDEVTATGHLDEGFGMFAGAVYEAQLEEVVRPQPGDIGRLGRDWLSERIRSSIPNPEAALGISFLSGHRQILPDDIGERLRILGLTHIVVASGFHLTIVVRYARKLFVNISKYLATFSSVLLIFGFLLITGFSTSMTRASLVAGLSLLAWYYGRNIHPVVLLTFVAAITVLINPAFIWGDMGWYLSFAAFGGVIILAPLINSFFFGDEYEPGFIRHTLLATTAAQIATFPIVAFTFGHYSPLALLANLLLLPLVPYAMLLTFAAGIAAIVSTTLGSLVGLPAYGLLFYMTRITDWLAASPWAAGEIEFGIPHVIISYTGLAVLIVGLRIVTGHRLKNDNPIQ